MKTNSRTVNNSKVSLMNSVRLQIAPEFILETLGAMDRGLGTAHGMWLPTVQQLEEALAVAFWASLGRDEGRPAIFAMSLNSFDRVKAIEARHDPGPLEHLLFKDSIPFEPRAVVKLSPAIAEGDSALLVGPHTHAVAGLHILGIDLLFGGTVRLVVRGPGQIAIRFARETFAFVDQAETHIVDHAVSHIFLPGRGEPNKHTPSTPVKDSDKRIYDLIVSMVAQGNGGTILVIPNDQICSARHTYPLLSPQVLLRDADAFIEESRRRLFEEGGVGLLLGIKSYKYTYVMDARKRGAAAFGRLTAVDGAVVVNESADLIGFGTIMADDRDRFVVERVSPARDGEARPVDVTELGGTRHQSAARYVAAHPDTKAIVASHDGGVSIIVCDKARGIVQCMKHAEWLL